MGGNHDGPTALTAAPPQQPKTALTIPQYFLSNCVQGMDAMTHAVEAYVSTISTPLTGEWNRVISWGGRGWLGGEWNRAGKGWLGWSGTTPSTAPRTGEAGGGAA